MGFVFYDTETTGLRPGFDQIVHFAAIRTDADLVELDRFEVRSRLRPHQVPHPKAVLANGLSIEALVDPALPSYYGMMGHVRRKLSAWSPAIFIGYNSIRFDEEMLRHAFFQTLHPAYLTNSSGNCRSDAMTLALTGYADDSPCLNLGVGAEGRPSFKLDLLAAANGLTLGAAHDAMVDAETTLALCRRVSSQAPHLWQRVVRFSNKSAVAELIETEPTFFLTEFRAWEARTRLVCLLTHDAANPNGRLCFDLAHDPRSFADSSDDELTEALGSPDSPIRRVRVNAAPAVAPTWDASAAWTEVHDLDQAAARAEWLATNAELKSRLSKAYTARRSTRPPSPHVEDQLYDAFQGPADEMRMNAFHNASRQERLEIVSAFDDPRLKTFGRRLIYTEHRSALGADARKQSDLELANQLLGRIGGGLSLPAGIVLVDELVAAGVPDPESLLPGLREWMVDRLERATGFAQRPDS